MLIINPTRLEYCILVERWKIFVLNWFIEKKNYILVSLRRMNIFRRATLYIAA